MSNPFNDKINKAVAEAARKVMEQTKEAEQIEERAKWRSSSAAKPDSDNDWDRSPKSTGGMRASSDKRGDTGGEYNHSSLENRKKAQVVAKTGKTTKASNTSLKGRIRSNLANKQPKPNLPEEAKKKVVVKTNEPIGYKIADIGPGGKEYNIKTDKAWDKKLKKEEVEQTEEGYRPHHTNPKPGWALSPELKAKFAEIERKRATKAKYVGKSIPKSDKMEEEVEQIDETGYSGSPAEIKAKYYYDIAQKKKLAKQAAAKKKTNKEAEQMEEETSQIAERLIGKQHKIDANKNGKIDAHDFKLLRKKTKAMKESVEPLAEEATPALSAAMKAILADAFHMYFKAHTFHWNVEGANFPEYHKFFGDVYEQLFDTIDPIAEEIRALGEYAPRSLTELKGSTSIDDSSVQTPTEMFGSLLSDNSKILAGLTNGYKVAEAAGEIGLSNFLQDKIDAHKKLGWMIKSVSKGA